MLLNTRNKMRITRKNFRGIPAYWQAHNEFVSFALWCLTKVRHNQLIIFSILSLSLINLAKAFCTPSLS